LVVVLLIDSFRQLSLTLYSAEAIIVRRGIKRTLVGLHWPFDGWSVTFGTARKGLGGAQAPPCSTKCNTPSISDQCTISPYCCIMARCSAVLMCPLKSQTMLLSTFVQLC